MLYGVLVLCVGLVVSVGAPALRVRAGQLSGQSRAAQAVDSERHGGPVGRGGRVLPVSFAYLVAWLSPLFAVIGVDLSTTRRVHPVPLLRVALFVVAFFKADLLPLFSLPREVGRVLLA